MRVRTTTQTNGPEKVGAAYGIPGGTDGAEYSTIGYTEDTVYRSRAVMKTGQTATGKTWHRLEPTTLHCFSWRRGNRMRLYTAIWSRKPDGMGGRKRVRHFTDVTSPFVGGYWSMTELESVLLERRGVKTIAELIRKEYPLAVDIPAGRGITPYLALPNIQEFTRAFYGPKYYRKDLVRGVANRGWLAQGGLNYLTLTKAFAPLVPTDWIARDLLELGTPTINAILRAGGNNSDYDYRDIRRLLRTASPKQVRQLFKESGRFVDRRAWMLRDTMRTWELVRAEDPNFRLEDLTFSGWDGLHDTLSAQQRLIRTKNHEVEHNEEWLSLVGHHGEYEITVPKDTHTLITWGETMGNCIGGYSTQAVRNTSYLYAVMKDGKMVCNMEIMPGGKLNQMVGKYNARLPEEDYAPILAIVEEVFGPQTGRWVGQVVDPLADWERELLEGAPPRVGGF